MHTEVNPVDPVLSLVVQIKCSWHHWPDSFCCYRGHQGWRGPLMGGGNWCQKWEISPPLFLLRLSTYSVSQEGSRCHKKSIKSTSNYPGNWQWNWKSLWPRRQPIPHHLHAKIPAVWQRRFRCGDVLFPVPTLFTTITFIVARLIHQSLHSKFKCGSSCLGTAVTWQRV